MWISKVSPFYNHFKMIIFDNYSCKKLDSLEIHYIFDMWANYIMGLIENLKFEKAKIVGYGLRVMNLKQFLSKNINGTDEHSWVRK